MTERVTKMQVGKFKYTVNIKTDDKYHWFDEPPFALKDELSAMKGSKWLGREKENPRKTWRVDNCRRNNFNIAYLEGLNPFEHYKTPLDEKKLSFPIPRMRKDWNGKEWPLLSHQPEFILHILQRKHCIIAGEMGTAKTLAVFVAMEMALATEVWYVAPKSALTSVKLEAMRWQVKTKIRFMTYDELKKILAEWKAGTLPPKFLVYDESSRVKTASSQRSQAADYLAESMRNAYGYNCYIIEMSGSPAPKSPLDWYQQCEIACPGYIREGTIHKFEARLAVCEYNEDNTGFNYRKRIAWRDGNPKVCHFCGLSPEVHKPGVIPHEFRPVDNQIELLYKRLGGLVLVKFKKDCLDLPDKVYRTIKLRPSRELMSAARMVTTKSKSVIESMTLLRELSDGFQYKDHIEKSSVCTACKGTRVYQPAVGVVESCKLCSGTGVQNIIRREVIEVESPKIDALTELLDEVEEQGRLVVFAGFTGSIDRICAHVRKLGWEYIRVDGRGWASSIPGVTTDISMLRLFQEEQSQFPNVVFIGHPGSAGMGITLTASAMTVYYSNDFNAESRIQSEDRIHRVGMDTNRGATIVDLVLLPTDQKVLDNLARKRELQSITLGELQSAIDNYTLTDV